MVVNSRLGRLKPRALLRPGVPLSTLWLAVIVDRHRYCSCVVADKHRRRLSALFVDAVERLDRLALSSATAVAKV